MIIPSEPSEKGGSKFKLKKKSTHTRIWCQRICLSVCSKIWPQLSQDWQNKFIHQNKLKFISRDKRKFGCLGYFCQPVFTLFDKKVIFWLNSYLDSHHLQGVWNLPHTPLLNLAIKFFNPNWTVKSPVKTSGVNFINYKSQTLALKCQTLAFPSSNFIKWFWLLKKPKNVFLNAKTSLLITKYVMQKSDN